MSAFCDGAQSSRLPAVDRKYDHLGHLDVTGCRLVEGAGHDFAVGAGDRARHVGDFLRTLVDQ